MWKWMSLFLRKIHILRCWGRISLLNWIGAFTLSLLVKLPPGKLRPWFILLSFFPLRLLCISINLRSTIFLVDLGSSSNVASLSTSYRYYFGRCSSELAQLVPIPYSWGKSTCYSDKLHDFSVTIPRCFKDFYVSIFFPRIARFWNSLPTVCFPLTYGLSLEWTNIF